MKEKNAHCYAKNRKHGKPAANREFPENMNSKPASSFIPPLMAAVLALLVFIVLFSAVSALFAGLKVYPKIITPGTPPENEKVFFDFTYYDDPKPKLRILDLTGRKVREISALNAQAVKSGWRLVWDGKDESGSIVLPGIYIYQWEEGAKTINGTIVVSR